MDSPSVVCSADIHRNHPEDLEGAALCALSVGQYCLQFVGCSRMPASTEDKSVDATLRNRSRFRKRNLCEQLTYVWASSLLWKGFKSELTPEELWDIDDGMKSDVLHARLKEKWEIEMKLPKQERSLQRAIVRAFGYQMVKVVLSMFSFYVLQIISAGVVFPNLIRVLGDSTAATVPLFGQSVPVGGLFYTLAFFVCECTRSVLTNNMWFQGMILGQAMQVSVREMAYVKLTKLKHGQVAYGRVLNIISTDTFRLNLAGVYGHFVFTCAPFLVMLAIFCSISFGPSVLVGLATMVAFIPLQSCVAKRLGRLRTSTSKITDHRVSLMSEILKAVKLIKLYAWEERFSNSVAEIRGKECEKLKTAAIIASCNNVIGNTSLAYVMAITFLVHVGLGGTLNAASAFSLVALFNTARFPLAVLAVGTRAVAEARIGMKRTGELLSEEEMETATEQAPAIKGDTAVKITGTFEWSMVSADAATAVSRKKVVSGEEGESESSGDSNDSGRLEGIDLDIISGSLVAIVGPVGAGKSSLLVGGVLGHMTQTEGPKTVVKGSVAVCMQESWIFNGTLRENILFGLEYQGERYRDVVEACALTEDLNAFPAGDQTEIGERGVNLSGGQKARVSLARAVYADADVILLDDPLSAVDVHVGKHLMDKCICGPLLANKTRILVTHQTQFLEDCDLIVVMEKGKIQKQGTYADVEKLFASILPESMNAPVDDGESDCAPSRENSHNSPHARTLSESSVSSVNVELSAMQKDKDASAKPATNTQTNGRLIEAELRKSGAVSTLTLKNWVHAAGGNPVLFCYVFLSIAYQLTQVTADWWLAKWAEEAFVSLKQIDYAVIYLCLGVAISIVFMMASTFYHMHALVASQALHNRVFKQVLQGAMSFFDTTPMGRIISNFSADLDIIDTQLPMVTEQCYNLLCRCVASLILISAITTWFLIPMVPLMCIYAYLAIHFRHAIRQLKRMDNMSKGPLFSHVGSTARGLCTIRAFRYMKRFLEQERALSDEASRCHWAFGMGNRWIGFRLDVITTTIVTVTAFICTCMRETISPALAALSIVYALQMSGVFQYGTRLIAESEALMTSVERLTGFEETVTVERNLLSNAEENNAANTSAWPTEGVLEFKNVRAAYRAGLDNVLKGVSFKLPGRKKLGICGRTGSGKSSLTLCLWRMLDIIDGGVEIDGVDTSTLGLHTLRSKLAIIPQDPILFIGTIRSNLDPFLEREDSEIWAALSQVHLGDFIQCLPQKLDTLVEEGGGNFSQGQCQLICFARALLRGVKIIALDEATASVDMTTDALVGATIREAFQDCTMLIIAHRLHTIVECDYILVLDDGHVAEFDTPQALIKKKHGAFYKLVDETGSQTSEYLKSLIQKKKAKI
eukprot:Stramenopile-MAST_4_protein_1890